MEKQLEYKIGDNTYTIYAPFNNTLYYKIGLNESTLGYINAGYLHEESGASVWVGTTTETMQIAAELGAFIESSANEIK